MRDEASTSSAAEAIAGQLEARLEELERGLPRTVDQIDGSIRRALDAYYHKDYLPLLCSLTEDALFIGAGPDVARGRRALIEACGDDADTPSFYMGNVELDVKPMGFSTDVVSRPGFCAGVARPDLVVATGIYDLFSEGDRPMLTAVRQRLTLLIRFEEGAWRTFYLHASNEWGELVQDEVFPIQVSSQTYDYVNSILRYAGRTDDVSDGEGSADLGGVPAVRVGTPEMGEPSPRFVHVGTRGAIYTFDPHEVLYIKARGKKCEVHTPSRVISLPYSLGSLEAELDDSTFFRVHRSYLVNGRAVECIEGGAMTLIGGEQIGIPRRKVAEIRSWLLAGREDASSL